MPIEVKLAPISMIIAPRSLSSLIIVDIPFISGVIITNIKRGSFAHRFGFKVNDIIKKIGSINIERVNDIKKIIESADRNWNIGIIRDEKNLTLIIK